MNELRHEEIVKDLQAAVKNINDAEWQPMIYVAKDAEVYTELLLESCNTFHIPKMQFAIRNILEVLSHYLDRSIIVNDFAVKRLKRAGAALETEKERASASAEQSDKLMRFWTAFSAWLDEAMKNDVQLFLTKYHDGYTNFGNWVDCVSVDNDKIYKINYGENFEPITEHNISFDRIKKFIEVYYDKIIEPTKGRLKFTVEVNEMLKKFKIQYKLKSGKLNNPQYKTEYKIGEILNYEQFERKVRFAEEAVLHSEFLDKHCALCYIADAFCYFKSMFKRGAQDVAKSVNQDINSKVYSVVTTEINEIGKLINAYFDIRHNEKPSEKENVQREPLTDGFFVEYLFNRINALLMLLRIKHDIEMRKQNKNKADETVIPDDGLPF
jgi:hypothetical protein